MNRYLINTNRDNNQRNEVHTTECSHLPTPQNRLALGMHYDELDAVAYAKRLGWHSADGCFYCCPRAHHG